MLCRNSSYFLIRLCSVLILACFCTIFLNINNTFAVSDYSETITSSSGTFFTNCDLSCIQQYRYLILDWTPVNSNNFIALVARFSRNGTIKDSPIYFSPWASSKAIIDISNISSVFTWDGTPPPGINLFATLTESYSSCPEPQPCPVIPEYPYDQKLDNITHAIYVCGAILLVLYFFYCIYRLIIRNSGAK